MGQNASVARCCTGGSKSSAFHPKGCLVRARSRIVETSNSVSWTTPCVRARRRLWHYEGDLADPEASRPMPTRATPSWSGQWQRLLRDRPGRSGRPLMGQSWDRTLRPTCRKLVRRSPTPVRLGQVGDRLLRIGERHSSRVLFQLDPQSCPGPRSTSGAARGVDRRSLFRYCLIQRRLGVRPVVSSASCLCVSVRSEG